MLRPELIPRQQCSNGSHELPKRLGPVVNFPTFKLLSELWMSQINELQILIFKC